MLPNDMVNVEIQKSHTWSHAVHYCNGRLQPVTGLICSLLLFATYTNVTAWIPESGIV